MCPPAHKRAPASIASTHASVSSPQVSTPAKPPGGASTPGAAQAPKRRRPASTQASQIAHAADRQSWDAIADQLRTLPAGEHAKHLLAYVQMERPQVLTFLDVQEAYYLLCMEEWIDPLPWRCVAVHFAPMTGGKKYRPAVDPETGRKERRERVYAIPSSSDAPHRRSGRVPTSSRQPSELMQEAA